MAEYINKQDLIKFLDSIQQPKMPITEGFKYITIDGAIKVVSERPTADVIERSEYDKAIQDINKLTEENNQLKREKKDMADRDMQIADNFSELCEGIRNTKQDINNLTEYYVTEQGSVLVSKKAVLRVIDKYLGDI